MIKIMEEYQKLKDKMNINSPVVCQEIEQSIIKYQQKFKRKGAIIGLSGGLDSSVVTALSVRALGKEQVKVLLMPDSESSQRHVQDALDFARQGGIKWEIIDLTSFLRKFHLKKYSFLDHFPFWYKIKSILYPKAHHYYQQESGETPFATQLKGLSDKPYHYAEQEDRMVVGCTNKTEQQIGFLVKYGCDHLADLMPIINLYKSQVYQLAEYLKIPSSIIQKEPSPDLLPGLDDQTMIGMPYEEIDLILLAYQNNFSAEEISKITGIAPSKVKYILDLVYQARVFRRGLN
jgi:NAD+ synthase